MEIITYCQWCIAKNGGGYMQTGVAKGLKVPCLFMITEVSIRCQKPGGWVYGVYPRIPPPNTPLHIAGNRLTLNCRVLFWLATLVYF